MTNSIARRLPAAAVGPRILALALLVFTALVTGCGGSSRAISIITPAVPQLVSISVGPPQAALSIGITQQFAATGVYSDGSKRDVSSLVTWTSSAVNVATVTSTGVATAVSLGSSTITAALGSVFGTSALTVGGAALVSITVTPATPTLAVGSVQQFTATGIFSDATTHNLTAAATWVSTTPGILSISNAAGSQGLGLAGAPGTTTITATFGAISGSTMATVTGSKLVSLTITPANARIATSTSVPLTAVGTYSDNTTQNLTAVVGWTSSNAAVASVATVTGGNEIATGLATGTTTITAAYGGVSRSTGLTVSNATLVSIAVTPASAAVPLGTHQPFIATGTYSDNTTQNITTSVTWSSSAPAVATISNAAGFDGVASPVAPGTTTISAALGAISGTTPLTVTAATLVSIGVTPANPTIARGTELQFTAIGVYSDNSTQNLTTTATWSSATATVAAISNAAGSNGLATASAITGGTTLITASVGAVTSPAVTLTVSSATLVSLAVTPATSTIAAGTTQAFVATATYSDNSTQNVTTTATWTSATPATATISNAAGTHGMATAVGVGTTAITATLGGITSAPATLTVTAAALVSISVQPTAPSIPKGGTQAFVATGTYSNGTTQVITAQVTWQSGTPVTASISNTPGSNGTATGTAIGTTVITATDPVTGIVSGPVTLTVTAAVPVSIAVTPTSAFIGIGGTESFTATVTYSDGTTANVTASSTWASATAAIATISNAAGTTGVATGLTVGTTLITASIGALVSNQATLTVTPPFAYAVNFASNSNAASTVSQYGIATDGTLTPLNPASAPAGQNPYSLAVDPTGQYLYVANYTQQTHTTAGTLSEYAIGANGQLNAIGSIATPAGPNGITANPTGPYVYVADYDGGSITQFTIGTGGVLAAGPAAPVTLSNGYNPASVAVTPAGSYAYVAAADGGNPGRVYQFSVAAGGALTPLAPPYVAAGVSANWIVVDPTGRYVYVANAGANTVSQFVINPATGALTNIAADIGPSNEPWSITIDASGSHAYVTNRDSGAVNGGTVQWFDIGANGALTLAGSIAAGTGPSSLAIDPTGHFAYVTDRDSATAVTITEFSITAGSGALTPLATTSAGVGPAAIITTR